VAPLNFVDLIVDAAGNPLRLFHGTCRTFDRFSLEYLVSTGCHFGSIEQADHFTNGKEGGRTIPVFLRSRRRIDIGNFDLGWRYPFQTIYMLRQVIDLGNFLFSDDDVRSLGSNPGWSLPQAYLADVELIRNSGEMIDRECQRINRKIESLLRARGVDCLIYTNWQEPPDGVGRDAYLVLNPEQIISALTLEPLG